QALRDERQLPAHERVELRRVAGVRSCGDRAQHIQRLQQVLDVVRGARAGLVNRLQVARFAQLLLAQLGDIELAEQLAEQVQVPLQRRPDAIGREDAELERAICELHGVRRAAAALPAV